MVLNVPSVLERCDYECSIELLIGRLGEAASLSWLVLHIADKQEARGLEENGGEICGGSVYFCMFVYQLVCQSLFVQVCDNLSERVCACVCS